MRTGLGVILLGSRLPFVEVCFTGPTIAHCCLATHTCADSHIVACNAAHAVTPCSCQCNVYTMDKNEAQDGRSPQNNVILVSPFSDTLSASRDPVFSGTLHRVVFYVHAKSRLEVVTQEGNSTPSNPNPNTTTS